MLSAIFQLVQGIVGFFEKVFDIILFLVTEIVETVGLALQAVGYCAAIIVQLPVVWAAAFTAIITIAIIFKIKG